MSMKSKTILNFLENERLSKVSEVQITKGGGSLSMQKIQSFESFKDYMEMLQGDVSIILNKKDPEPEYDKRELKNRLILINNTMKDIHGVKFSSASIKLLFNNIASLIDNNMEIS